MVALAAVFWTAALVSQTVPASSSGAPPPATGLVVGRVVDGASNRPIAGAIVTLEPGGGLAAGPGGAPRALTSSTGQFVFRKLPKRAYQFRASRLGYADGSYGQRRPGGVPAVLQLEEGQRVGDVVIPLWKHATIAGSVVDEAAEPLIGVSLRAFRREFVAGRPRLVQAGNATTDDRGLYRFAALTPGDYLVAFVWREASMPTEVVDLLRDITALNDPKNADLMRQRMIVGLGLTPPGTPNAAQVGGLTREIATNAPVPPDAGEGAPLYIYPTQFYPGVPTAARARAITLASGESRESVDFALRPLRTVRVTGTVLGPNGPVPNLAVRLVPTNEDTSTELETSTTLTGSGGEFTLLGVPAGQYTITVLCPPRAGTTQNPPPVVTQIQIGNSMMISSVSGTPNAPPAPVPDDPTLAADVPISVGDRNVNDVLVTLQRAPRLTGRFEFDGTAPRPEGTALMRIPVSLQRADGGATSAPFLPPATGHADETGAFKTVGVAPGKYVLRVGATEGWTFRSATADGRDLSDAPFDVRAADINNIVITFTDRRTKLSGTVRSASGNFDPTALVVVFPADSTAWTDGGLNPRRLRSARTDRNGGYAITGLPPGDYYVTAVREETTPQWQDPQVLEDLARSASQLHLNEGDTRTQDLKSTGGGL